MPSSSHMKELRRVLERRGFTLRVTRGGHLRIEHPDMDGPVFGPSTPSDCRSVKNLLATIRRKMRAANDNAANDN